MNKLLVICAGLCIFGLVGCQTMPYQPYAREVKKKPGTGGLIALKLEHRDEDRAKAQQLMESNCTTDKVKVTEEGEVAIGSTTTSSAKETKDNGSEGTKVGSLFGIPITSGATDPSKNTAGTATTTAVKEWEITYECAKAVAQDAPAAGKKKKTTKQ